ncbi:MAG: Bax inhibitor-1/YccA family protein, partial [Planctomycetota bacterium]
AASVAPWMLGGAIGGLVVGLIIGFKPKLAPSLAVPYALLQGLMLGAISAFYYLKTGGEAEANSNIVLQAVILTFGTAFAMLGLYAFRIIRLTERMKSIIFAATGGIMLFYLISFVLSFFGVSVPLIHSSSGFGIGFSVFVVGLAAFNLLMDFEFIEKGSAGGAPKYMEWYGAFALVVTLIWLYIEFLRLLAKLRSNE